LNRSLIDTDILSYFLKGDNKRVTKNFEQYLKEYPKILISEITYFEILVGFFQKGFQTKGGIRDIYFDM